MTIDAKKLGEALLAQVFETTIAKQKTFQISLADFPIEAAIAFMQYGIGRKFNDAVGGSDKTAETKLELAEAMIADWKQGKIGRQPTARVPDETKMLRAVLREQVKAATSAEKWKAFAELTPEEQASKIDAIFEKQPEAAKKALMAEAAKRIEAAKERAAQAKALGDGLEIDL